MLTAPGIATTEIITLLFDLDQFEDRRKLRNEALHSCDDAEHSLFNRARLWDRVTRLYAQAGTLLALGRSILSRPLISTILDLTSGTTSLEAWISLPG